MAKIEIDKAEFVQLWSVERKLSGEMAAHFGVSVCTINARAKEWGLQSRGYRNGSKTSYEDTKEFRDAWDAGVSREKIGEMLGCSKQYVSTLARRYGYPKRPHWNASQETKVKEPRAGVVVAKVMNKQSAINENTMAAISLPAPPWGMEAEPVSEDVLRAGWRADVMEQHAAGLSVAQIAKSLWCAEVDVLYEINRHNNGKTQAGVSAHV